MEHHLRRAGFLVLAAAAAYIFLPSLRVSPTNRCNTPGLVNPGNDCYANSIIQALSALKDLRRWVAESENETPWMKELLRILNELNREYDGPGRNLSVKPLLRAMEKRLNARFTYGQHDAHEFLVRLLDLLEEDAGRPSPFTGILANSIKCLKCQFEFERTELSQILEIQPDEHILEFRPELIEGYRCENCNSLATIEKQTSMSEFPAILAVHVNRSSLQGGQLFRSQDRSLIHTQIGSYTLQSVVFHKGSHNSGHYTSARRKTNHSSSAKRWWQISDTFVKDAFDRQITSRQKEAYILFFAKTDWTQAIDLIRK